MWLSLPSGCHHYQFISGRQRPVNQCSAEKTETMYSILDIDLDYFNLMPDAEDHFRRILTWADRPVTMLVDRHNHAFGHWRREWRKTGIAPSHILHVDEHHDMMDQRQQANIGNFMLHAMRLWPRCRVHWQVQEAIDSPAMWLEDETWNSLRSRFTHGPGRPTRWPKPDVVCVCTSPDFVEPHLTRELTHVLSEFMGETHTDRMPNHAVVGTSRRAAPHR
jgi:hypothetical protein